VFAIGKRELDAITTGMFAEVLADVECGKERIGVHSGDVQPRNERLWRRLTSAKDEVQIEEARRVRSGEMHHQNGDCGQSGEIVWMSKLG
jgi:hypothetical protein